MIDRNGKLSYPVDLEVGVPDENLGKVANAGQVELFTVDKTKNLPVPASGVLLHRKHLAADDRYGATFDQRSQ